MKYAADLTQVNKWVNCSSLEAEMCLPLDLILLVIVATCDFKSFVTYFCWPDVGEIKQDSMLQRSNCALKGTRFYFLPVVQSHT